MLTLDPEEIEEAQWISCEHLAEISLFEDCREAADQFLSERQASGS
ncbi:MAG: hypothetical protein Q8Q33_04880 [Chlamydiota bacterium]|nr:hypothetical protein [Chlamydiota bacterium]